MIRVDPTAVSPPNSLTNGGSAGVVETENARRSLEAWLAGGGTPEKWSFAFSAYSGDEVKRQLELLFHGKCAYCESSYGATQPMDVEHWRPKGRVEGNGGVHSKPGYYWLAASWDNLLPSCIDCNRRRRQVDALTNRERSIGKQDQFPLAPGSHRATKPGEEAQERPLLLNPRADEPSDHLRFTQEAIVRPTRAGTASGRARTSIEVYALNRTGLVLTRKEYVRIIQLRVARVEQLGRLLAEPGHPERIRLLLDDLLGSELSELARMRQADRPYALMSRQLIDAWMDELTKFGVSSEALTTPIVAGRAQ